MIYLMKLLKFIAIRLDKNPLPVHGYNKRRKLLQAFSFFAGCIFYPVSPLPARGADRRSHCRHHGRRHAPDAHGTAALRALPYMPDRPSHALPAMTVKNQPVRSASGHSNGSALS